MVLGTSPCTVLYTHRKCSSYSARPVMCSHAIAASWWSTKNTGGAGWLLKGVGEGSGLHSCGSVGLPVHQNSFLPKPTFSPWAEVLKGQEPTVSLTFPRCNPSLHRLGCDTHCGDSCLAGMLRLRLSSPQLFLFLSSRCRHLEEVLQNQRMLLESVTTQVAHKKSALQTSAKQIEDR